MEFQSFIPVWISCPALHERKPAITWYFLNKKQWLAELVLLWWHNINHLELESNKYLLRLFG
jgi:hypothetical protein